MPSVNCQHFARLSKSTHLIAWPSILGDDIKTEAWILRNLISLLASAARRPHTPRSREMRILFKAIGIPVPEPTEQGSLVAMCY